MKKLLAILLVSALAVPLEAVAAQKEKAKNKQTKAELIVVESGEYASGREDARLTAGLGQFLGMEPVVTKMTQLQAMQDETLANLDYSFLPLYLIKKTDEVRAKMEIPLKQGIAQETAGYIVLPHQTRTGVYTNKEAINNVMEIFVMSQCPYGVMAENAVIEAKKNGEFPKDKVVKLRYIVNYDPARGFTSLHGSPEWEEDVRQLLIAKYYPKKLWQYLAIRNKDYRSSRWDKAMEEAGIDPKKIAKKFDKEGLELLKAEAAYGEAYGISASPTFLWEGKVLMDFGTAAQIEGFSFLVPSKARGAAVAPTGSC